MLAEEATSRVIVASRLKVSFWTDWSASPGNYRLLLVLNDFCVVCSMTFRVKLLVFKVKDVESRLLFKRDPLWRTLSNYYVEDKEILCNMKLHNLRFSWDIIKAI
jgi:hypothetical protein